MRKTRKLGLLVAMMALLLGIAQAAQQSSEEKIEKRTESKKIPFVVKYEVSRDLGPGRILKVSDGKSGEILESYAVRTVNGRVVGRELLSKKTIAPVHAVFRVGAAGYQASRGGFSRTALKDMVATGYDTSQQTIPGGSGRTATGMRACFGCVAVDPRVIPLGTRLFIEGYGFAIASDTGGAIKGNRIDLCYNSRAEALRFGRRKVVVHVFGKLAPTSSKGASAAKIAPSAIPRPTPSPVVGKEKGVRLNGVDIPSFDGR